MSFSAGVKEELAGLPLGNPCCRRAELAGVMLSAGSMHLRAGGLQAEVSTESPVIARKVFKLIKSLYGIQPAMVQSERHRLNRNYSYRVTIEDSTAARRVLEDVGALNSGEIAGDGVQANLVRLSCCEGAFLRGLFLGCGSMSDPGKGYHLELVLEDEQLARSAVALLAGAEINARIVVRSGKQVIYIKEADHVSGFLATIGAHGQMLTFESIRVEKGVRNTVNRVVNCDTANMDKALRAAAAQVENILLIERVSGLQKLPETLRHTAEARLENPDATLERLGELIGVSKSGLNHRFRKIADMAEEIRTREEYQHDHKEA